MWLGPRIRVAALALARILWDTRNPMSISVPQKKRGRPATGQMPKIGVRLPALILGQVEHYREEHDLDLSEAIRRLVELGLKAK